MTSVTRRMYVALLSFAVALLSSACAAQPQTSPAATTGPAASPPAATMGTDTEPPAATAGPGATEPAATAPGDTAAPTTEGPGGGIAASVRAAITGDEGTLNPYTYVTGFPGWNLLMLQYDSLMQIDTEGLPQPWLATSVETSDDGLVYSLELAEGVTWHDGEPLTADDVVFTIEYFTSNPAASRFSRDLNSVEGAEATGELSLEITLSAPNPSFPLRALADVPIIPEHVWSDVTTPEEHQFEDVSNVGTGPYRITDYAADQSYTFAANPDYFRGSPAVDELVIVQFADDAGALAAMNSREVDVMFDQVAPEQIELLAAQEGIEIQQGPEFTNQLIYYDTQLAPFDDVAVRQAISLAVDRQDLVDTVYLGAATLGNAGWVHPDSPAYNADVETVHDVAAANSLLDEGGYADSDGDGTREYDGQPMRFEMLTPSGDSLRLRTAELVSTMLAEVGIQVSVSSVEQTTWEEAVWPGFDVAQGRNYQMAMWGWSPPTQADPGQIGALLHSDPVFGSLNLTGYVDPEADELADQLRTEGDPEARQEILDQLQVLIAERQPFVTLLYPDGAYAYDSTVYDGWTFISGQGIVSKLSLLTPDARP
jgi:peptide/nickel transport system substrate-binding protein